MVDELDRAMAHDEDLPLERQLEELAEFLKADNSLEAEGIQNLEIRRTVCDMIIRANRKDPRVERIMMMQRKINAVLAKKKVEARKKVGKPEPPAMVVGLKPLRLTGKRLRGGE